ncbi:MAG: hypothetical protein A3E82_06185 [Gammaproteobacteria bacterium RIFCSPHIGHO2_12_FULL_38_11]|nr:MAG: hypothetical protein A3E82_06185 [Gammaproteobacteria bacterium RIFCSPHIGHO2_12_FULL_38_11]
MKRHIVCALVGAGLMWAGVSLAADCTNSANWSGKVSSKDGMQCMSKVNYICTLDSGKNNVTVVDELETVKSKYALPCAFTKVCTQSQPAQACVNAYITLRGANPCVVNPTLWVPADGSSQTCIGTFRGIPNQVITCTASSGGLSVSAPNPSGEPGGCSGQAAASCATCLGTYSSQ